MNMKLIDIAKKLEDQEENPDVVHTGVSIQKARVRSTKDYRDDIIEATVAGVTRGMITDQQVRDAVDAYHTSLRLADRGVKDSYYNPHSKKEGK